MTHQLDMLGPLLDEQTARRLGLQRTRSVRHPRLALTEGATKTLVKSLAPSSHPIKPPSAPTPALVDVPRAANADPHTSHLAAERIKQSGALGKQQRIVLQAVKDFPGSTSAELAQHIASATGEKFDVWRSRAGRRLSELAVFHVARGPAKVCSVNGTNAITWRSA